MIMHVCIVFIHRTAGWGTGGLWERFRCYSQGRHLQKPDSHQCFRWTYLLWIVQVINTITNTSYMIRVNLNALVITKNRGLQIETVWTHILSFMCRRRLLWVRAFKYNKKSKKGLFTRNPIDQLTLSLLEFYMRTNNTLLHHQFSLFIYGPL